MKTCFGYDRYRTTLDRERQLIEEGTHPLFLDALLEYDKIRQKKIDGLKLLLDTKEEVVRKGLEAREKSLWESWQDERRKLWYEMTLTFSRKQRQLVFEKDMLEAEAIDPSKRLPLDAPRKEGCADTFYILEQLACLVPQRRYFGRIAMRRTFPLSLLW